jgi:hypothetical protein
MILNKSLRIRSTIFSSALLSPRVAHARFAGVVGRGASCQRWFFSLDGKNESQNLEFSTLYELQSAACKTFAPNNLFGTYMEKLQDFEYMSYNDFGKEVDRCRTMLRNLGKQVDIPRKGPIMPFMFGLALTSFLIWPRHPGI